MNNQFTTTMEFPDGEERSVIITYASYPATRGARDKYGVPLEPDEPASIEVESVIQADTREDVSGEFDSEEIEQKCYSDLERLEESRFDDVAERRAEDAEWRADEYDCDKDE